MDCLLPASVSVLLFLPEIHSRMNRGFGGWHPLPTALVLSRVESKHVPVSQPWSSVPLGMGRR